MATKKVEAEVAPAPEMREDVSATAIPGASPDEVYAELERGARSNARDPQALRPVSAEDMPTRSRNLPKEGDFSTYGGRIDDGLITFGDKVFYAEEDKRTALPNTENMSTGPRRKELPAGGDFLPGSKSFRRVPYRRPSGTIRVDN